jgi:hypothetical protein
MAGGQKARRAADRGRLEAGLSRQQAGGRRARLSLAKCRRYNGQRAAAMRRQPGSHKPRAQAAAKEAHQGSQAVDMRIAATRHNVRQVGALGQAPPRGAGGGDSRLAQPVGCPVCWGPAAGQRYLCQLQYSAVQHTGRAGKVRRKRGREGEGSTAQTPGKDVKEAGGQECTATCAAAWQRMQRCRDAEKQLGRPDAVWVLR